MYLANFIIKCCYTYSILKCFTLLTKDGDSIFAFGMSCKIETTVFWVLFYWSELLEQCTVKSAVLQAMNDIRVEYE